MSATSFHFDDVQPDDSISQINLLENLSNEGIYDNSPSVPSVSTSVQTTQFKFPKSADRSAYLLLNDDNVTEARNLLKVFSPFMLKLNLATIFTVCLQRTGFEGDRREFLSDSDDEENEEQVMIEWALEWWRKPGPTS